VSVFIINLLSGVSFGVVLFLLAIGLSIFLGLMGILNMAHGALYMVGAYVGWSLAIQFGWDYWVAVLAAAAVTGVLGTIIERGLLRKLLTRKGEQVLLTFGVVYVLMNVSIWIWGADPRVAFTPPIFSQSISFLNIQYPLSRISIVGIGIILIVALWWLQEKTRTGAIIRASTYDREMVTGLGINIGLLATIVFFFASLMAGFAGVMGAQLLGVYPDLAWDVQLLGLTVVVIGGLGDIRGTLLGSMIIGLINSFGLSLFPEYTLFIIYLAMIVILLFRPSGLLRRRA
jgi:branched-chain amino acid transport system permease protein